MPVINGLMAASGQGRKGTGSMMGSRKAEIDAATARNTKSGSAKDHGAGMQTDVHRNRGLMSGAGGLGNDMGSGKMQDHDSGLSGNMGGGMGGSM